MLSQQIRKYYHKTLGTSLIKSHLSPLSLWPLLFKISLPTICLHLLSRLSILMTETSDGKLLNPILFVSSWLNKSMEISDWSKISSVGESAQNPRSSAPKIKKLICTGYVSKSLNMTFFGECLLDFEKCMLFDFKQCIYFGSWKKNEVAGFVLFSQWLFSYF